MLNEKLNGGKTKAPMKREDRDFHCDTLEEHNHTAHKH